MPLAVYDLTHVVASLHARKMRSLETDAVKNDATIVVVSKQTRTS